jgi:uncharacterized peroxidase-related enzyme
MARIQIIPEDEATGELKQIYEGLVASRGKLANVHRVHSLNPASMVAHMELYMTLMYKESPLKRYQREMLAVVTSANNKCKYCIKHHSEALNHYWKDDKKTAMLAIDFSQADISKEDELLCEYAELLTLEPAAPSIERVISRIKKEEISDRKLLDSTMIIGYYNFVNRLVMGLNVEEEEFPGGYKY